ncbi:MAG TPA: MraY family glycosyltransferase [Thermoanaerobaculia bacterium]|nr:MraY family glycosyltransferase [Thermoanaerobaculia bacterium]
MDKPGGRRHQPGEVPRLGGLAIVAGLALGVMTVVALQWNEWAVTIPRGQALALLIGGALIFTLGIVDDLFDVPAAKKFGIQVLAATILVVAGWSFNVLRLFGIGDVQLGVAEQAVSVLFIVGVINAINLIDGLDGLAGGVVAIISASFLAYAILLKDPATMILMGATAGSCLGFLPHNWAPARIFMGDSGALTLGFLLAGASVQSFTKTQAFVAILVPILALGVPMFDTLLVMLVRFLRQPHGPLAERFLHMFRADRNHLHHLLEHLSASRGRVVWTIYASVLLCCAAAILVALSRDLRLGVAIIVLEFFAILLVRKRGMAAEARRLADERLAREGLDDSNTARLEDPELVRIPIRTSQ